VYHCVTGRERRSHDTLLREPEDPAAQSPFEALACRLCGDELTAMNCKWKVMPGICHECAPPGQSHRNTKSRVAGIRPRSRAPYRWCLRLRLCECGARLATRRQKCDKCRDETRRTDTRAAVRKHRAERGKPERHCQCGAGLKRQRQMCDECRVVGRRRRDAERQKRHRARTACHAEIV